MKYRQTTQTKPLHLLLFWLALLVPAGMCAKVWAETVYLRDGSVLTGTIISETEEACVIANEHYGEVSFQKGEIVYQEKDPHEVRTESFVITEDHSTVLAHLQRPVPAQKSESVTFNLLVPGDVQAVLDANGVSINFDEKKIADNSLVTVGYSAFSVRSNEITIVTLQQGLIESTTSGRSLFRLKYLLDQEDDLRIIVKYPKALEPESMNPDPEQRDKGLVVWEKHLRRQQQFNPQIIFLPNPSH